MERKGFESNDRREPPSHRRRSLLELSIRLEGGILQTKFAQSRWSYPVRGLPYYQLSACREN